MKPSFRSLFTLIAAAATLSATPQWSSPPLIVDAGETSSVGIAETGNALVVYEYFIAHTNTGIIKAAELPFLASAWGSPITLWPGTPNKASKPNISVNLEGEAIAVWPVETSSVYYSLFKPASGWSPIPGDPIDSALVAMNHQAFNTRVATNNAFKGVAVWDDSATGTAPYIVRAAIFNGTSWLPSVALNTFDSQILTYPACGIDARGNVLVSWLHQTSGDSPKIQAATYNASTGKWSSPIDLDSDIGLPTGDVNDGPSVAMNERGEAVVAYDVINFTSSLYTPIARSFSNQKFSNVREFLLGVGQTSSNPTYPSAAINAKGKALVALVRNNIDVFAKFRKPNGKWEALSRPLGPYDNLGFIPSLSAAITGAGQGVIVWNSGDSTLSAFSDAGSNSWNTTGSIMDGFNPVVAANAFGNVIAVNGAEENFTSIDNNVQSLTLQLNPLPARQFEGKVVPNTFPMQVECIHQLTWKASLDPEVVAYRLYANGVLIKTFSGKGPFSIEIRDACCGVSTIYKLVTVAVTGSETNQFVVLE